MPSDRSGATGGVGAYGGCLDLRSSWRTSSHLEDLGPAHRLPTTRVVLASAHLDHGPGNNRPRNLAALCQRCHMLHDASEHRRTRWRKRFMWRATGNLLR
jgi:hypothetical protein